MRHKIALGLLLAALVASPGARAEEATDAWAGYLDFAYVYSSAEPAALTAAAPNVPKPFVVTLRRNLEAASARAMELGEPELSELETEMHVDLLTHCGNATLLEAIDLYQSLLVAHIPLYQWTPRLYGSEPFLPEHLAVAERLEADHVAAAAAALEDHLRRSLDRAVGRIEVVRQIARRGALVTAAREIQIARLDDIARPRERDLDVPARRAPGVPAGVVEMQMRIDDPPDVLRRVPEPGERIFQPRASVRARVLDAVDVPELLVLLVAESRVDQDQAIVVLDQEAAQRERNAVARVGRDPPLPQRLGNDAEHRAAVQVLETGLEGMAPEPADGK